MIGAVLALLVSQGPPIPPFSPQSNSPATWTSATRTATLRAGSGAYCIPSGANVGLRSAVTVVRATGQSVYGGGGTTLRTCGVNELAVGPAGAEVYAAGTNVALQSETSCVGNAVQTPWALSGTPTCTTDAAVAPSGTTTMDAWTNSTNTHGITQPVTIASSATATTSFWTSKASPGTVTGQYVCTAGTANSCTCGTSNGSTCSCNVATTTATAKFTSVGSAPVRCWFATTCAAALTNPSIAFYPGEVSVSTGTANLWGVQVETGIFPTPYVVTAGASATRNATVATIPLPDLHTTDKWCVALTATSAVPNGSHVVGERLISNINATTNGFIAYFISAGGQVQFDVYDSGGAARFTLATSVSPNGANRYVFCANGSTLTIHRNGVSVGGATGGGGTGNMTATTAAGIGSDPDGTDSFNGSIRDVKICPLSSNPRYCR